MSIVLEMSTFSRCRCRCIKVDGRALCCARRMNEYTHTHMTRTTTIAIVHCSATIVCNINFYLRYVRRRYVQNNTYVDVRRAPNSISEKLQVTNMTHNEIKLRWNEGATQWMCSVSIYSCVRYDVKHLTVRIHRRTITRIVK